MSKKTEPAASATESPRPCITGQYYTAGPGSSETPGLASLLCPHSPPLAEHVCIYVLQNLLVPWRSRVVGESQGKRGGCMYPETIEVVIMCD